MTEVTEVTEDRLETQEFYEVCQQYRHALDMVARPNEPTAAEAFEYLKGWVRGYASAEVQRERERERHTPSSA